MDSNLTTQDDLLGAASEYAEQQSTLSEDKEFERKQVEREINDLLTDGFVKEAHELEKEIYG